MNKQLIILISILVVVLLVGTLMAACGSRSSAIPTSGGSISSPTSGSTGSSTADGQTLMQQRCTVCHSTGRITSAHMTAAQWQATVDKMINNGAQLTPQEEQTLVTYLAQNYK